MILMLAPGPNMSFGSMPSGSTYVSNENALITITNNRTDDQTALANAGCYTLTPFGGWGSGMIDTLADLYAADAANGLILPGQIGFPRFTAIGIYGDGTNNGTWAKTGSGIGTGNWTQVSTNTAVSAAIGAAASAQEAQAAAASASAAATASTSSAASALANEDAALGIRNVYDPSLAAPNTIIADGGQTSSYGGYITTGFMPVVPGDFITFDASGFNGQGYTVQFYDAHQTYLSNSGAPIVADSPIAVPATAFFARASFPTSQRIGLLSNLMAVHSKVLPPTFRPYGVPAQSDIEQQTIRLGDARPVNLFIAGNGQYDTQLQADGVTTKPFQGLYTSDYIGCRGGVPVNLTPGSTVLGQQFFAYDHNRSLINAYDGAFFSSATTFTPPDGAYWWRFTNLTTQIIPGLFVVNGAVIPSSLAAATPARLADVSGQWDNGTFAICGDSISDSSQSAANFYGWVEHMAAFHGASTRNFAVAGRASNNILIAKDGQTPLAASDFAGVSCAILMIGTNDAIAGTPIGSLSDPLTAATYIARVRNWVNTVYHFNEAMQIVLCTSIYCANLDVSAYAAAIRAICAYDAIPLFDAAVLSGIGPLTAADKLKDGIHPTAAAQPGALTNPAIGFFKTCLPR